MRPGSIRPESLAGIVPDVSPELLIWRATTGADFRDEVWQGIYHVAPDLTEEQIRLENEIECWLLSHWSPVRGGRVFRDARISRDCDWTHDFRVPSFSLFVDPKLEVYSNGFVTESPDVVIEFTESSGVPPSKIDFYGNVGIQEIWVIDFRTGNTRLIELKNKVPAQILSNENHPIYSPVTGVNFSSVDGIPKLELADSAEASRSFRRKPK